MYQNKILKQLLSKAFRKPYRLPGGMPGVPAIISHLPSEAAGEK